MTKPRTTDGAGTEASRIEWLDGLRLVAVLLVASFHYFVRWTPPASEVNLYPHGGALLGIDLLHHGGYGVQLFFVISGFVIALTLTKCDTLFEFVVRRFSRLAPAMILCAVITFLVVKASGETPFEVSAWDFVPSLIFIDPSILNALLGRELFANMDGAYWSIYVEVVFYAIAATCYFLNRQRFLLLLAGASILSFGVAHFAPFGNSMALRYVLIPDHLPWFLFGAACFHMRTSGGRDWKIAMGIAAAELIMHPILSRQGNLFAVFLIPVAFLLAATVSPLQRILSPRWLVTAGQSSYSFYLLHQRIGVTVLFALPAVFWDNTWLAIVAVFALCALLIQISILSFRYFETPANKWIRRLFSRAPASAARLPATRRSE